MTDRHQDGARRRMEPGGYNPIQPSGIKDEIVTVNQIKTKSHYRPRLHASPLGNVDADSPSRCDPTVGIRSVLLRGLIVVFISVGITTQAGCQIFRKFGGTTEQIPVAFYQLPTQQQLLTQLKTQANSVRQLSSNVSVSIPGAPKIKGTLQVEFPDRMRMKAGLMGVSEMGVDVGSNQDHFWIWSRASLPNQPPAFYYANHQAFQQSEIRKSIPLDPKWLIEGLGLVQFEPNDVHYGPTMAEGGRMKLFTVRQTVSGPQTRVALLDAGTGLVEQQAIYNAGNQLIAYTNTSNYKTITNDGQQTSLPQRVELHMMQADGRDTKMVIDLGSISLAPLYGDPAKMWSMPNPDGVVKLDLTQMSTVNSSPGLTQPSQFQRRPNTSGVGFSRN